MEGHSKEAIGKRGRGLSPEPDLGLAASSTERNKCLLFKSPSLGHFGMAAQADKYTYWVQYER